MRRKNYAKKIACLAITGAIVVANASAVLAQEAVQVSVQNQSDDQTQESQVDRIVVEPWKVANSAFQDGCLKSGTGIIFSIKVYRKDGTQVPGSDADAKVLCELRKKDGTKMNALYHFSNPLKLGQQAIPEDPASWDYATLMFYEPYGYEEEFELTLRAAEDETVTTTYEFRTVKDQEHPTFAEFDLGEETDKATIGKVKEVWNEESQNYTVTFPKIETIDSNKEFVGWRDYGMIYAPGETERIGSQFLENVCPQHHTYTAVWKNKTITAPKNVKVVKQSGTSVKVSWSAVKGADGYRVLVSEKGQPCGVPQKDLDVKKATCRKVTGLDPKKTYEIRVQVYQKKGDIIHNGEQSKAVVFNMKRQLALSEISVAKNVYLVPGNSKKLNVTVKKGTNAAYIKSIRYAVRNSKICTVRNGKIKAKGVGITTIKTTITLKNGLKKTFATKVEVGGAI